MTSQEQDKRKFEGMEGENQQWQEFLSVPPEQDEPPQKKPWYKKFGLGGLAAILLALAKWKTILGIAKGLFALLKFSKFGMATLSMFASIGVYAWFYGIKWAIGFVILLGIHEYGHMVAAKRQGIPVTAPVFIPFLGALIGIKEPPKDAMSESIMAYGGPLFGFGAAMMMHIWAMVSDSPLFYSLAYFGYFLTLFNLVPASPLDGGRIVAAVSPLIWVIGIPLLLVLLWWRFNPILILVLLGALQRVWSYWKQRHDPYYQVPVRFRFLMGIAYLVLLLLSGILTFETYQVVERMRPY